MRENILQILLADDHEQVRQSLRALLEEAYPSAHIEEACDGDVLVLKSDASWDIIISDIAMPQMNGFEALQRIRKSRPQIPVLMLSIHSLPQYARRAKREGASGYCNKEKAGVELIEAVTAILAGGSYFLEAIY